MIRAPVPLLDSELADLRWYLHTFCIEVNNLRSEHEALLVTEVIVRGEVVRLLILQQLYPFPLDGELKLVNRIRDQEQLQGDVEDSAKVGFVLRRSQAIYRENKLAPKSVKPLAKRSAKFANFFSKTRVGGGTLIGLAHTFLINFIFYFLLNL